MKADPYAFAAELRPATASKVAALPPAHRLPASRLQYKPLKDPRTTLVREAWHWDLVGPYLPPRDAGPR